MRAYNCGKNLFDYVYTILKKYFMYTKTVSIIVGRNQAVPRGNPHPSTENQHLIQN